MAPGWHTYWKYSGDAGFPLEMKWNLPPGWKVGEIQWPIPLKIRTIPETSRLTATRRSPAHCRRSRRRRLSDIGVSNSPLTPTGWFARKSASRAAQQSELNLPVGPEAAPANADLFASSSPGPQSGRQHLRAGAGRSRAFAPREESRIAQNRLVDFFPLPDGNTVVGHPRSSLARGMKSLFAFRSNQEPRLNSLPGLIVFGQQDDGNDRAPTFRRPREPRPLGKQALPDRVAWPRIFSSVSSAASF